VTERLRELERRA
jgi:hypothetical protein